MIEFLKEFTRDFKSLVLFVFVILIAIAIVGAIPFPYGESKIKELSTSQRALFGLASAAWLLVAFLVDRYLLGETPPRAPSDPDYVQRLTKKNREFREIVPEYNVFMTTEINGTTLQILRDDITNAKTDVIVSSDDNYLQAAGGVAKAILRKGGQTVESELNRFRARKVKLGHLAVTSGGGLECQYVFHTAILDLDKNLYPDEDVIRTVTRNCLTCGRALGLGQIAFPILGGGTASKQLTPAQSFQYITNEIANFVASSEAGYEYIAVYIFDMRDVGGDPVPLVENALRDARTSAT